MSVTAAQGFVASGVAAGIKASGAPDLSLVATADHRPVTAAGVFTTNLVVAAPVQLSRRHLAPDGKAAAVVLNSGNANAATGEPGLLVAEGTAAMVAEALGCDRRHVLVCSTGLIGIPMDLTPFTTGVPAAAAALAGTPDAGRAAAEAIMTTDTVAKQALATAVFGGITATFGGMAKGAAMLSPAMATMLAVITTDAAVERRALQLALGKAVDASFNLMTTDGSRSTNDTVLVLANGAAGNPPVAPGTPEAHALTDALTAVCASLSDQMAADAEGATKFVRLTVKGARSNAEARRAARAVAQSQLVKCSLFGGDPYWGRILSELGASGAFLDPDRVDIAYNGFTVCVDGVAAAGYDDAALTKSMQQKAIDVVADLRLGNGEATVTTVDLTPGYIDENIENLMSDGAAVLIPEAGIATLDPGAKAAILAEALPYIREFSGRTIVVKYGGNAMSDLALFAEDVVLMRLVGMHPVVIHGGGPQISDLMRRLGKEPVFVDGLRVTDAETVDIVRMALLGKVNREVVGAINRHGPYAVGLSGEDAGLITVRQRDPRLGFVGDVTRINAGVLERQIREEFIPVVAGIGVDEDGQAYNVNADTVAGAIAEALGAEKLVYLTNVPGLYGDLHDKDTLISQISATELAALLDSGALSEGMVPKISSCVSALRNGVGRAHLLDGRTPHALLLECFTREGVGTMVVP